MAKIFLAWELGAHYGHLAKQVAIADRLRLSEHELLFAVRDTRIAAELLLPRQYPFVQAPLFLGRERLRRQPANYAELLLADGFAEPAALLGRVQAWLRLLDQFQPDVMVADHAPTALVAARVAGVKTVQVGNGFEIPPAGNPLPAFNVCNVPIEHLKTSEARVVANINAVMRRGGRQKRLIGCLAEMFDTEAKLLTSFAELDHYGARSAANYIGPVVLAQEGMECAWRTTGKRKIFAYLHNGMPGTAILTDALRTCDAEVVCVVSGVSELTAARLCTPSMRVLSRFVRLETLLSDADVVVSNGGGLALQALLAGAPLLLFPYTLEQYMQSNCVENLRAGLVVGEKRERAHVSECLNELLTDAMYRQNAQAFARKYSPYDPGHAAERAAAAIARVGHGHGMN